MKYPFALCWLCLATIVTSAVAIEKVNVPAGSGIIHAVGTSTYQERKGKPQKLIGVFIEGIRPESIKGRDVILYVSHTSEFEWLLSAEGKIISFETMAAAPLEEGKGKPRIYLFDRAIVKEEPNAAAPLPNDPKAK